METTPRAGRTGRHLADAPRRVGAWLTAALPASGWLVLLLLFAVASWATIVTRTQWVSDSRVYLAYTWWYLGHSQHDSFELTRQFLQNMDGVGPGCSFCWLQSPRYDFWGVMYGPVVGPRVLYMVLSMPFVALFGGWGMLAVPMLAFAGTVVVLVAFVSRLYGPRWAFAAGAALILTTTVSRWSLMAMTEAPAMLFTTATLFTLPLGRPRGRRHLVWFLVLLELGLFTRQFAMVIPVAVFGTWLLVWLRDRRFVNAWFPFALGSGVAAIATLFLQSWLARLWFGGASYSYKDHFFHNIKYYPGYGGGKLSLPHALARVVKVMALQDFGYMRGDLLLLGILGIAAVGVVWRFRSEVSILALGMMVATYALNVMIVLPTYFRYAAPQFAFVILAAVALLADLFGPRRRRPSRSTEAVPGSPWYERTAAAGYPPASAAGTGAAGPGAGAAAAARWRAGVAVRTVIARPARDWVLLGGLWLYVAAIILDGRLPAHPWTVALSAAAMTVAVALAVGLATPLAGPGGGTAAGATMLLCPAAVAFGLRPGGAAPSLALVAAALYLTPVAGREPRRWYPLAFTALVGLAVVASPYAVAFLAGVVVAYVSSAVAARRPGTAWWPFAAGSLAVLLAALAVRVTRPAAGVPGWHAFTWRVVEHTAAADFRLLAPDRVLYAVIVLAAVALVAGPRRDLAALAAGTFAAGLLVQAATRGVGYEPYLVGFPAALLAATAFTARLVAGWRDDRAARQPDRAASTVPGEPVAPAAAGRAS